eukprot:Skav222623  [mRNA]  locus=scaffold4205:177327:186767:+ [translate_table: standard]
MGYGSEVLQLEQTSAESFFRIKEVCAGVGGLSKGAQFAGFETTVLVEKQPKFCALHSASDKPAVIEGDISRLSTISRMFRASPTTDGLGMGFSCQPFSKGGDRRGGTDTRAYTLAWGLFIAYILKAPVVILECVLEAPDHQYVRQCIHSFQQCTGFHASERVLDLAHMWPSSRKRWWCVLIHATIGKVPLGPLPKLQFPPMVSDLIPEFCTLEEEELEALILQESERSKLRQLGTDLTKCEAPLNGTMPTALHSWGNQLVPCACECRNAPMSTQRLMDRGFFGTLVKFRNEEGGWSYRHPAPVEVALFVGMPLKFTAQSNPRLELAALGQIASPFQSAWICGLVKDYVLACGVGSMPRELQHAPLRRVVDTLFEQRDSMFAPSTHTTAMQRFQERLTELLAVPDQAPVSSSFQPATVSGPPTDFVWPAADAPNPPTMPTTTAMVGAVPGFQWQQPTSEGVVLPTTTTRDEEGPRSQDSDAHFASSLMADDSWKQAEQMEQDAAFPAPLPTGNPEETSATPSADAEMVRNSPELDVAFPARSNRSDQDMDESEEEEDTEVASSGVDEAMMPIPRDAGGFLEFTTVTPQDLVDKRTIVYNRTKSQVLAIRAGDDAKIEHLLDAESPMNFRGLQLQAWSILGHKLSVHDLVANWQVIVVTHTSDSIFDQTNGDDCIAGPIPRVLSMLTQGVQVADDEMDFYLQAIASQHHCIQIPALVLPRVLDCEIELDHWITLINQGDSDKAVVSAVLADGHWSPVLRTSHGQWHTTAEGARILKAIGGIQAETHEVQVVFDQDCGFQTFAWLIYHLGCSPHIVLAHDSAAAWRFLFWQHVAMRPREHTSTFAFLGGHKDDLQMAVATMLREHGVPNDQVLKRADHVIGKLGKDKLQEAILGKRPWAQIKQLANMSQPKVQLVLPSELEQVLKSRSSNKQSIGSKETKTKGQGGANMPLASGDILIPPGVNQHAKWYRPPGWLFLVTVLMSVFRVGEATHPGPFSISVVNSTGLNRKAEFLRDELPGIIAASETQLSELGIHRFAAELKVECPGARLSHGSPAPRISTTLGSVGGTHTGVGFISSFPMRPVPGHFDVPPEHRDRVHAAHFWMGKQWISGGIVYGFARHAETASVRDATNKLIEAVAEKITIQEGPRFIAGDWNQEPGHLAMEQWLISEHWVDIQSHAQAVWGVLPQPTCKGKTRKDYLYICPRMQELVSRCLIKHHVFADHSIVQGQFQDVDPPREVPIWRHPAPLPWDHDNQVKFRNSKPPRRPEGSTKGGGPCQMTAGVRTWRLQPEGSPTVVTEQEATSRYAAIWKEFEHDVDAFCRQHMGQGLTEKEKGRAETLERTWVRPELHVLKPARKGEFQLEDPKPSYQLKHWVIQLRRLTNLERTLSTPKPPKTGQGMHVRSLWGAILRAKGFTPSFAAWWKVRPIQGGDAIIDLNEQVPTADEVSVIREAMQENVEFAQRQRLSERAAIAQARYATDVNRVFHDVKGPRAAPVETLLDVHDSEVVDVPEADSIVILSAAGWDPKLPVFGDASPLRIFMMDDDQVWFTTTHNLLPGMKVSQRVPVGSLEDIFQRFHSEWMKRWDRHRDFDPGHWEVIENFIDVAFPQGHMEVEPIELDRWMQGIASKPSRTATGMDGISRSDLLNLPSTHQQELVTLMNDCEQAGLWPEQLQHGGVHSLQKVDEAATASQFRPITVLALSYRVWSSLRARDTMQFLQDQLPADLFGSVQGRSAATMWFMLQWAIEQSHQEGWSLQGASADVVKCFNTLPRGPLFKAAIRLGLATRIVKPWASIVTTLQRHFVIRGSYGEGLLSHTGYPEGDALSVCAMVTCNCVIHRYMSEAFPRVRMLSFVDNWDLTCDQVELLPQAMQRLDDFSRLLHLEIDHRKTIWWASQAADRAELRQHDIEVTTDFRELGGHVQTTRRRTNRSMMAKVVGLDKVWQRLAVSRAPRSQKLKVIRMKAWPSAFYGSSISTISDKQYTHLRAGAVKALRLHKSGVNSQVFLALCCHPQHDPECYTLMQSFRMVRRLLAPEVMAPCVDQLHVTPERRRPPGPVGLLLSRLDAIGWSHVQGPFWVTHEAELVDLLHDPIQEVEARLHTGFQSHVGQVISSRPGFAGLHAVDARGTLRVVKELADDDRTLIQMLQSGAFVSGDQLGRAHNEEDDKWTCKFCGQPDSLDHRWWRCAETAWSRQQMSDEAHEWAQSQEDCTRLRGWFCTPKPCQDFQHHLHNAPSEVVVGSTHPVGDQQRWVYVFTDGTGKDPAQPVSRLVAWAWCYADSFGGSFHLGAAGSVPGRWQTVIRAELMAMIHALEHCAHYGLSVVLFSDNIGILRKAWRFQAGEHDFDDAQVDGDLWIRFRRVASTPGFVFRLHHVFSHQDAGQLDTLETWICQGNECADRLASQMLTSLDLATRNLQQSASEARHKAGRCYNELVQHLVRVGQQSVRVIDKVSPSLELQPVPDFLDLKAVVDGAAPQLSCTMQGEWVQEWLRWFASLEDVNAQPRWISWLELLIHYQLTEQRPGVESVNVAGATRRYWRPVQSPTSDTMQKLARAFSSLGWHIIRLSNPAHKATQSKPHFHKVQVWINVIPIRIKDSVVRVVQDWWTSQGLGVITHTSQIKGIPVGC